MLNIIVAVSRNGVIGKNGEIPWNLPIDLQRFKNLTIDKNVIMGLNTWYSLPKKPLPNRHNIVMTTKDIKLDKSVSIAKNKKQAIDIASKNKKDIFIIGGESIYRQFLEESNRIYLTIVEKYYEYGDSYFPTIDFLKYNINKREYGYDDINNIHYKFFELIRNVNNLN
ncbi:MAG: dihydrofolate reductase [archaeon]